MDIMSSFVTSQSLARIFYQNFRFPVHFFHPLPFSVMPHKIWLCYDISPEFVKPGKKTVPIRLTQVGILGYDQAHARRPSNFYRISASLP